MSYEVRMSECDEAEIEIGNITNMTTEEIMSVLLQWEMLETTYKIPIFIFMGVLMLIGIPGNMVVLLVYHFRFSPSTPKFFIMALAVFDLLNCVIGMPFEIVDLRFDLTLDVPWLCKMVRFNNTTCTAGSVFTLLAVAVDRYRKICQPFKRQASLRQTRIAIGVITAAAFVLSLPALLLYGNNTSEIFGILTVDCSIEDVAESTVFPRVYLVFTAILCVAAIAVLTIIYTFVSLKIVQQKRAMAAHTSPSRDNANSVTSSITSSPTAQNGVGSVARATAKPGDVVTSDECESEAENEGRQTTTGARSVRQKFRQMSTGLRNKAAATFRLKASSSTASEDNDKKKPQNSVRRLKKSRVTMMMLLVTAGFIVSYLPHLLLQLVRSIRTEFVEELHCNHAALVVYKLFLRSYFINSVINPVIYGFYNSKFRRECKNLLRPKCIPPPDVPVTSSSVDHSAESV